MTNRSITHNHAIGDITGSKLLGQLEKICENKNETWTWQDVHYFNINDQFRITVWPEPTEDEPGNAKLEAFNIKLGKNVASSWSELRGLVEKSDGFITQRETFMHQPLQEALANIKSDPFSANFLLLFEIARRVPSEKDYPVNQKQTQAAIEKVFNSSTYNDPKNKSYQAMVQLLIEMFTDSFMPNRKRDYDEIMTNKMSNN